MLELLSLPFLEVSFFLGSAHYAERATSLANASSGAPAFSGTTAQLAQLLALTHSATAHLQAAGHIDLGSANACAELTAFTGLLRI